MILRVVVLRLAAALFLHPRRSGLIAEQRSWGRVRINCVSGCPLTDAWCYEGTRLALSPQALRSPIIVAAIASAL